MELTDHALTNTSRWLLFAIVRTTIMEQLPGSFSGFLKTAVDMFWSQSRNRLSVSPSFNFEQGIYVPHLDRAVLVRCRLGGTLADEKAHKGVHRGRSHALPAKM